MSLIPWESGSNGGGSTGASGSGEISSLNIYFQVTICYFQEYDRNVPSVQKHVGVYVLWFIQWPIWPPQFPSHELDVHAL